MIQEREAKITELEAERDRAVEAIVEIAKELPPEPPKPKPEQRTLFHHHKAQKAAESVAVVDTVVEDTPVVHPDHPHADPEPINSRASPTQIVIPDFSITAEDTNPVNSGFGTEFPKTPTKGDMFLRVDMLPSKLYKWNDQKWIEVDKTKTDSFAYDQAYIQHLIEKINSGEYDVDMLSAAEQEQIQRYLNGTN